MINDIHEFAIATSSNQPVPGGGGVSALNGALAASLAEMLSRLTIGKKKYIAYTEELESIINRLSEIREQLLACIDKDADAFLPLSKAYSLKKDDPNYEQILESSL